MHEASLVSALFDQIERSIAPHAETASVAVRVVHVRIGELAGVEPQLFRLAYDTLRVAGPCTEAELVVVAEPAAWACRACATAIPRGGVLRCPSCGGEAQLTAGGAVFLDRLELEVPDV